jgi:hypothetical protein
MGGLGLSSPRPIDPLPTASAAGAGGNHSGIA